MATMTLAPSRFSCGRYLAAASMGSIRRMIFNRSDVISSIVRHNPMKSHFQRPERLDDVRDGRRRTAGRSSRR